MMIPMMQEPRLNSLIPTKSDPTIRECQKDTGMSFSNRRGF